MTVFNLTFSMGRWFHLHVGQADYGYLNGIWLSLGNRSWSWSWSSEKGRKKELTHG